MAGLVKAIDEFVERNEERRAKAFVVFTGPRDDLAEAVSNLAVDSELTIPLCFFADPEADDVRALKLNEDVPLTILVARGNVVLLNLALAELQEDTKDRVLTAFEEALEE